jgi:phage shock protein C
MRSSGSVTFGQYSCIISYPDLVLATTDVHYWSEARRWDSMATALQRPSQGQGRVIAGVCAAIADRFGISRTLVRVAFVVFGLMGAGVLAYVVLWVLIPSSDQ